MKRNKKLYILIIFCIAISAAFFLDKESSTMKVVYKPYNDYSSDIKLISSGDDFDPDPDEYSGGY